MLPVNQGNQRTFTNLDLWICSQLKQRPRKGVCRGVMPSEQEESGIGGKGVGVDGGPILVIPQAPQASPQGGVALWLNTLGPNSSCQIIVTL